MHECPECHEPCNCGFDIDDMDFGEVDWCTHWVLCQEEEEDEYADDEGRGYAQ